VSAGSAGVLRDAARVLEEHGWVQGSAGTPSTGFCTIGALAHATNRYDHRGMDYSRAYLALAEHLDEEFGGSVADWNDQDDRTMPEVVKLLSQVADLEQFR